MRFTLTATALLASLFSANAQNFNNNVTGIEGTWSTGSGAVSTGGQICIPGTLETTTFTYPNNTGISYAFTEDGFFEEVRYRYNANATNPQCITGFISWQHGTYTFNGDGLTLTPFQSDGRIQVQDPCAAVTNQITYYNNVMQMKNWAIIVDPLTARYTLNLNQFDGAPLPPMYLIAKPPNMLPTHTLTGTNSSGQTSTRRRRSVTSLLKQLVKGESE
ncbi:Protein ROT1 [Vanrija pseudolonga]|uniref:Protein ROT1 n=1 Tax=Vanrija pseudolonga TaxID=143232 RepID=A0AAF1BG61_9TREE|nr:Protein ROT1 [Vanrija pseudolonga]